MTSDEAQDTMSVEQAYGILERRIHNDGTRSRCVMVLANPKDVARLMQFGPPTPPGLRLHSDSVMPEGRVYILTEGTLRNSLPDWPQRDIIEIGGA